MTEHFNLHEENYSKGPRRIVVYFKLLSSITLGKMKQDAKLMEHLNTNRIYERQDHFAMNTHQDS
jgi:hypothetical protein